MISELSTVMGMAALGGEIPTLSFPAPLFFASALPSPTSDELYAWMKVAVALLAIGALAKQIWPGRKPPIDVDLESLKRAISETYVTKDDLHQFREDMNERFSGMNAKTNGLNERVSNVFGELRQLTGRFDMLFELQKKGKS